LTEALDNAAQVNRERRERGDPEPLAMDKWADPPAYGTEERQRYITDLRAWHERYVGPLSDEDFGNW
jgi:hypothetical protein